MASSKEIRTWAKENGFEVSGKGIIPKAIVEAYNIAHEIVETVAKKVGPRRKQAAAKTVELVDLPDEEVIKKVANRTVFWYSPLFDIEQSAKLLPNQRTLKVEISKGGIRLLTFAGAHEGIRTIPVAAISRVR